RMLEDRRLPEQGARAVAARPVDLAEVLVELSLFVRIDRGTSALQQRIRNACSSWPGRSVAFGSHAPEIRPVTVRRQECVARGGLEITRACALQRGLRQ